MSVDYMYHDPCSKTDCNIVLQQMISLLEMGKHSGITCIAFYVVSNMNEIK
jgi:hypothetical protein